MITRTTYQTPHGKSKTGYIIDGRTYNDPYGKERVEIGSIVDTAGGRYVYTGLGGVKTQDSIAKDLQSGYDAAKVKLDGAYRANRSAIENATGQKVRNLERQKGEAEERYKDANRSAYGAYVSASNPYGVAEEQRARLGLADSGVAESSKLKLSNAYQTAISDNARAKAEYINEIENAKINAEFEGNIELAKALAEYENLVYRHGIDAAEAIANAEKGAFNAGIEMNTAMRREAAEQRAFEADRADAARKWASEARARENETWQRAYRLAQLGFSNAEIARTLGVSEDELIYIAGER